MTEPHVDEYPEAVPLRRVAPTWRTFAILLGLAAVGLGLFALFMMVMLVQLNAQIAGGGMVPPPPTVTVSGAPVEDEPEPQGPRANLPYPTTEDMRRPVDGAADAPREPSARDRFLNLGKEAWKGPRDFPYFADLRVSPNGKDLAYFANQNLVIGSLSGPQAINLEAPVEAPPPRGGMRPPPPTAPAVPRRELHPVGVPAWSGDGRFVYFANAGGRMFRFNNSEQQLEPLGRGRAPVPLLDESKQLIYLRSPPPLRVAVDDASLTEVVVGDTGGKERRVVVPAGPWNWKNLTLSPDGKRLAAVGSEDGKEGRRWRVFLIHLAEGKPEPLTPPAYWYGLVSWTPDGNALVYARSRESADGNSENDDLYLWDVQAKQETRLSRGGGFSSPSVSTAGELFFLDRHSGDTSRQWRPRLWRVSLGAARAFAAAEPEARPRNATEWSALFARVCTEAKVAPDARGDQLPPATLTRLDETFRRLVREQFKEEVPDRAVGLDRLTQEWRALRWSRETRPAFVLVVGAVQGEYLRRHQSATWELSAGPLATPVPPGADADLENAFAVAVNPFQGWASGNDPDDESDGRGLYLEGLVRRAQGRRVILVNDPATGRAAVQRAVDADLQRGTDLLKQGKAEEGERVLLEMMDREANANNLFLTFQVGKQLYEAKRLAALRRLLERPALRNADVAGLHNLLGLAQMDSDPQRAINSFKKALRCDLHFGPAYLNLAQAYEKVGDRSAARMCLRRALEIVPSGPLADDALEQLGRGEIEGR